MRCEVIDGPLDLLSASQSTEVAAQQLPVESVWVVKVHLVALVRCEHRQIFVVPVDLYQPRRLQTTG